MITRHDLADDEWARLAPMLPRNPGRGGRWADHRQTINGILFRTRTRLPVAGPAAVLRALADRV